MRFTLILAPVLGCLAAAACIDLTAEFHRQQQADVLVAELTSLYAWTPLYWEADRVGMLVPLLATPFEHPLTNLLVQNGISIFGALLTFVAFAWYVLRDRTAGAVGAAGAALFLAAAPAEWRFCTLNCVYAYMVPLALSLVAAVVAAPRGGSESARAIGKMARADDLRGLAASWGRWLLRRGLVALALTGLAYWMNFGIAVAVGPILVGRFLMSRRPVRSREGVELAGGFFLSVLGFGFGNWLSEQGDYRDKHVSALADFFLWPSGWSRLAANVGLEYGTYLTALGGLTAAGIVWLLVPRTRRAAARAWAFLGVAVAGLAVQFGLVGATEWLRMNNFEVRYLMGVLATLSVGVAGAVLAPPLAALSPRRLCAATVAASLLVPAVALWQFGLPSVASARAGVDEAAGDWTADILEAQCTHLVGDYWDVWPAMFHVNMTLADRGEARRVWAVAYRSEPTRPLWEPGARANPRVGWVQQQRPTRHRDPVSLGCARKVFPKLRTVERRHRLRVMVPPESP